MVLTCKVADGTIVLVDCLAQGLTCRNDATNEQLSACAAIVTDFTWMSCFSLLAIKYDLYTVLVTLILCIYKCHGMHVEVRGELVGAGFLLPQCGVLGIELRSSGLAASAFSRWAILLAPLELFVCFCWLSWQFGECYSDTWLKRKAGNQKPHNITFLHVKPAGLWEFWPFGCTKGLFSSKECERLGRHWTSHPWLFELSLSLLPNIFGEENSGRSLD